MIIYIRNFKALIDAWDFCNKYRDNKNLIAKPMIIEKKRKGKLAEIKVIMKLKTSK